MSQSSGHQTSAPDELTLDELRIALAPLLADAATFDGWGDAALVHAASIFGADIDVARLAYPDGAMGMITAWIEAVDQRMTQELTVEMLAQWPIRERIRSLVQFRLDAIAGQEEALKRATAIMAKPQNAALSLKRAWTSADAMWRLAGDTAADYNYYTKRSILAGIYTATLVVFAEDMSEDKAATAAFLARRIEGVMRFEKIKAKWLKPNQDSFSVARLLGRLRYPAR